MDIDFVFPYVDGNDPEWIARHDLVCHRLGRDDQLHKPERYRDYGYLKYMLRGVAKFMPWIRRVYMIVESESQIPEWVDRSWVHIVLHNQIMPPHILPTYNSSTIEMFLDRIPGLAEHFIYSNDDMYPTAPSEPSDWFSEEGYSRINFSTFESDKATTMFRKMCNHEWQELANAFGCEPSSTYLRPLHDMSPLTLTDVRRARTLLQKTIEDHLEPFRNAAQHNQYIYCFMAYLTNRVKPSGRSFKYMETKHLPGEVAAVIKAGYTTLCLNDVAAMDTIMWNCFDRPVIDAFQFLFPNPCKYEKRG